MRPFVPALAPCLFLAMQVSGTPGDEVYTRPGQIVTAADGARLKLLLHGERLAHGHSFLFGLGGLGAGLGGGATARSRSGRAPAAMTAPARASAVPVSDAAHERAHCRRAPQRASQCRHRRAVHSGRQRVRRRSGTHICGPVCARVFPEASCWSRLTPATSSRRPCGMTITAEAPSSSSVRAHAATRSPPAGRCHRCPRASRPPESHLRPAAFFSRATRS